MSGAAMPPAETLRCADCGGPVPRGRFCGDCLADRLDEPVQEGQR